MASIPRVSIANGVGFSTLSRASFPRRQEGTILPRTEHARKRGIGSVAIDPEGDVGDSSGTEREVGNGWTVGKEGVGPDPVGGGGTDRGGSGGFGFGFGFRVLGTGMDGWVWVSDWIEPGTNPWGFPFQGSWTWVGGWLEMGRRGGVSICHTCAHDLPPFVVHVAAMELFRSEAMQLVQLIVPAEAAHETVEELGQIGLVQFKDLNEEQSAFQRNYAVQVKRCDELARKLRFFREQVQKQRPEWMPRNRNEGTVETSGMLLRTGNGSGSSQHSQRWDMDELETKLEEMEQRMIEANTNNDQLRKSHAELVEMQMVMERASHFFDEARILAADTEDTIPLQSRANNPLERTDSGRPLLEGDSLQTAAMARGLGYVTGLILQEKMLSFERVLFRATRGNMFMKQAQIEGSLVDPTTGERVEKSVFVVFYAGERARAKIAKICEAFDANLYPYPEDFSRQGEMHAEVNERLHELSYAIEAGQGQWEDTVSAIASELSTWIDIVTREAAIYHILNMFSIDVTRKCLIAEGWIPADSKRLIQGALQRASQRASSPVGTVFQPLSTKEPPPTYYQTTKFTLAFQEIVDAYGVARYQEANPTVYTIITFPFLFAVMFGDVGHGLLLTLAAGALVLWERKLGSGKLNEMVSMCFSGRYVLLMMGAFSIYTGLLYNEAFSIPMSIFGGTRFVCPSDSSLSMFECPEATGSGLVMGDNGPYPVGVDPVWHGTQTELPFTNSMKMKMSIIMGVAQMTLGILISFFNQRFFRDRLSMVCEFVPQILFLSCLFGYLSFLIMLKWLTGSVADLYHTMIYMFLSPGNVDCQGEGPDGGPGCPENLMFAGQGAVQVLLLLIALVCVPWMLLPKPYILRKEHERRRRGGEYNQLVHDEALPEREEEGVTVLASHSGHGEVDEFDFGETFVHQMIHTIEFVLGAVSNTASYLRLWALSLAHAQLSAVFYDRILVTAMKTGSPILLIIGLFVFTMATLGVLMVMETLSAFLHALRLHWVEFQNKFYAGDGFKFMPFNFATVPGIDEAG